MSKCLRCGAGNEWIEPIAKEAKKPRRKRPKVRFVAREMKLATGDFNFAIYPYPERPLRSAWKDNELSALALYATQRAAERIAAALNLAEAVRRGEV